MSKRKATTEKPVGKGPMAAWVACGGVLVVLSFLFGTMVGDGGAASTSASAANNTISPVTGGSAQQVSPDAVPEHIRNSVSQPPGSGTRAPVQVSPQQINLGTVKPSQSLPASADIINTGTEPLTIRSSRANCGCTTVDLAGTVIPPGRSVPLNATFNTQENIGPRTSTVTVLFEDYDEPVQVSISANIQN